MTTPLEALAQKKQEAQQRLKEKGYWSKKRVYVGMATCEIAAGSKDAYSVFEKAINNGADFYLSQKGCAGRCSVEPTVEVIEEGKDAVLYSRVNAENAKKIVEKHLLGGTIVEELISE